jgi:hypothetical protein
MMLTPMMMQDSSQTAKIVPSMSIGIVLRTSSAYFNTRLFWTKEDKNWERIP